MKLFAIAAACAVLGTCVAARADDGRKVLSSVYVGAASCSASNCHGGDPQDGVRGAEHSLWLSRDPHAAAESTLARPESDAIVRRLSQSPHYAHLKGVPARDAAECRSCHGDQSRDGSSHSDSFPAAAGVFASREGVSCESCHGPAQHWLAAHVQPGWRSRPAEDKAALGFIDTKDLPTRVKRCAHCHIGSHADHEAGGLRRDVNHDLIAAGHPRLLWETAAYLALLPRHWTRPDNEAKLWAVGQSASAAAAAELLADRASAAERGEGVWPEFSEYRCAACHQSLTTSADIADAARYGGRRIGAAPWEDWHFPPASGLASAGADGGAFDNSFIALSTEMQQPAPSAAVVGERASELRNVALRAANALNDESWSQSRIRHLLRGEMARYESRRGREWEAYARMWLACAALEREAAVMTSAGRDALQNLRPLLLSRATTFGFDSPSLADFDRYIEDLRLQLGTANDRDEP